jgi:hypothetical protein
MEDLDVGVCASFEILSFQKCGRENMGMSNLHIHRLEEELCVTFLLHESIYDNRPCSLVLR